MFDSRVSSRTSEVRFFESEIKNGDISSSWTAKYFNIISVLKVILVEPIYITLQMNKMIQILSLLLVQYAFLAFVCYAIFKKKIFVTWWNYTFTLIHEIALACYFSTGFFFYLKGESRFLTSSGFDNVQFMLVIFLMVAIICGVSKLVVG